ncbi:MAG: UDP-N-acetylmuramoyl-L-alanine--D-glutamate ligase [Burkholderiales bacterium]|nr:UDP-N-acetylmuramoyl-L-alanine--D-glutamate ligase [Burkholderiales bacterium]
MARWCAGQGARVRVWDSRANPPQAAALAAEIPDGSLFSGELSAAALDGVDRVYKSPGLSPADARLAALMQAARTANVPVRGELDLFSQALAQLKSERGYAPKVLAITGTNGKTTTTSLTGQLVERSGRSVAVAGNIGPTMLDTLAAAIAAQAVADVEAAEAAAAQALIDAEQAAARAAQEAIEQEAARVAAEKQARLDAELAAAEAAKKAQVEAAAQAKADAAAAKAARAEARAAKAAAKANPDAALELPVEPDLPDEAAEGAAEAAAGAPPDDAVDAELVEGEDADELRELAALDGSDVPAQLADDVDEAHADQVLADEAEALAEAKLPDDDAPSIVLIPPPAPDPVFSHLPQVWVLELSSFQLDDVQDFNPAAATVLNITQDHLDWHGSMAAYAAAKARIFGTDAVPDTVMVINRDDPAVEAMIPPPVTVKPTRRGERAKQVSRRVVRFGLDAPREPGDFGLVEEAGMAWLVRAMELDPTIRRKPGDEIDLVIQRLMPADALRIRGRHNASNALAALALASSVGIPLAPMLHGLREYRGEPHRVEPIGMIGQVEFFDDSKGTNVGATVAALNGLGQDRAPARLVVILGGDGKGQDFVPLAEPLRRHARAAATIGKDAEAIEAVLRTAGVPFERFATLEEATRWAHGHAAGSDAVLLSPACASLDMFRDYKHRADVFVATVHDIADDAGEVLA